MSSHRSSAFKDFLRSSLRWASRRPAQEEDGISLGRSEDELERPLLHHWCMTQGFGGYVYASFLPLNEYLCNLEVRIDITRERGGEERRRGKERGYIVYFPIFSNIISSLLTIEYCANKSMATAPVQDILNIPGARVLDIG